MSVAEQEKQLLTAEDLWEMPEAFGKRFELVDGELVEMPGTGALHNLIVGVFYQLLSSYVDEHDLGLVFSDGTSYIMRRNPDLLRIPDVSFLSWGSVPEEGAPEGYWTVAPDLAVEIVSPNDRADDVHDKVLEYLDSGVRLVLVLWPKSRTVTVYVPGIAARELGTDDEFDGGEVLPGFRVRVAELFAVRRSR